MYLEGRYDCKIINQRLETTKNGTPAFVIVIQPLEYIDRNEDVSHGPPQQIDMYITANTTKFVIPQLESIGWTGDSFSSLDPSREDFHNFAGWVFQAFCKHEVSDKGRTFARWGFAGKPKDRPSQAAIDQADRLFKQKLDGRKERAEARGGYETESFPAEADIPF